MMLYKAISEQLPGIRLRIEHSISQGLYCRLFEPDNKTPYTIEKTSVEELKMRMKGLSELDMHFVRKERLTKHVREAFERQGLSDKVLLLDSTHDLYTVYYKLGELHDSYYGPLAPSTGYINVFDLIPYKEGMLLLAPATENPDVPASPITQEKMYKAFTDNLRFNRVIQVSNVGELNRVVHEGRTAELINVAEALHDKLLGRISDEIWHRRNDGGARVVLLAGPSSSGKTTTCKRLAVQLMTNLLTPKMISLDDYFVDRESTPKDETGDYDYESLYALDLERLNSDLNRLIRGEEINLPTYSFEFGKRMEVKRPLHLNQDDILLIEGIHGLNPELTASIPDNDIFKIYVSALTTLSIDDHNWIPTTDNRLLRRIVRDFKYRHTSALDTIKRWPSVRRGEEKWIFPYQENADATFNSSLIFELGVMRDYAIPILKKVPRDTPHYAEADRLIRFLEYFEPIPADQIPFTSLLREFLGGSSFSY
jgi:uridine kinase